LVDIWVKSIEGKVMKELITAKIELSATDVKEILCEYVKTRFGHEGSPDNVRMEIGMQHDQMDRGPGTPVFRQAVVTVDIANK